MNQTRPSVPPLSPEHSPRRREIALFGILILLAVATRFYHLGDRVMSHDESLFTQKTWHLVTRGDYVHDPMTHGPFKFQATAFVYWLFGDTDGTSRIPVALAGVVAVGLLFFFRDYLGRTGALVAAVLMFISPHMLFYSRYIRDEAFVAVWGLLLALCVLGYLRSRRTGYLYGMAAVLALFFATMETFFIYTAIVILFLSLSLAAELVVAASWPDGRYRIPFLAAGGISLAGAGAVVLAVMFKGRVAIPVAALVAGYALGIGFALRGFGNGIRRFPALDLLAVLWVFVLPQLSALVVRLAGRDPAVDLFVHYSRADIVATGIAAAVLLLLSALIGFGWDRRKFLVSAGIFYGISVPLFTDFFKNGNGLVTGFVGSLGYWLVQHGVGRGGQPWYYYPVFQLALYEFLPVAGAALAVWYGAKKREAGPETLPAVGFFGFWAAAALIFFGIAGERMPWLTVHIILPLILLSGWSIGRLIDTTGKGTLLRRDSGLFVLLLSFCIVALLALVLLPDQPVAGRAASEFLSVVAAGLAVTVGGVALSRTGRRLGWRTSVRVTALAFMGLLALITVHAAFRAAYVDYDTAREFLVYAHGAQGVRAVADRIENISRHRGCNAAMSIACDNRVAWPMAWYLRRYRPTYYRLPFPPASFDQPVIIAASGSWKTVEPLLGDRYTSSEYIRLVWPVQDYRGRGLAEFLRPLRDREYRRAFWDIWLNRDYTRYGRLTRRNYDPAVWPIADRMRLYVRKDIRE